MFPYGGPGVALLILRVSVAGTLYTNIANHFEWFHIHLLFAAALVMCLSLCLGLLTPFFSLIACAVAVANIVSGPHPDCLASVVPLLDALALALMGPGAYSLDAQRFGRREIISSHRMKSPSSE